MANKTIETKIQGLKAQYETLKPGKESLLQLILESELSESVYNSNAIENSTLSLKETERILLDMEISRNLSLREVFEAKNLARVMQYIYSEERSLELSEELILLLHKMLLSNINEEISGRFRRGDEYVRVGTHIAPPPEFVAQYVKDLVIEYKSDEQDYFVDKISKFHLSFENIHPFLDGNGRIGRLLINLQLHQCGYPPVIIRNKEKHHYYDSLSKFDDSGKTKAFVKILGHAVLESLHKRIAYLGGKKIISLADYAKKIEASSSSLLNKAKRQSIPAFREKGTWKIAEDYETKND